MLTETLLRIPFSVVGLCSPVPTCNWLQGKCAIINLSQAASGMILQNHRWLPVSIFSVKIAAVGSLKRVSKRIFKISKYFQRSKLKLLVQFFVNYKATKIVRTIIVCTESAYFLLKIFKKLFISWHNPFNWTVHRPPPLLFIVLPFSSVCSSHTNKLAAEIELIVSCL